MQPGIYILVIECESAEIPVGSLGKIVFPSGFYCYVGSALGPGGLARVSRHIRLSTDRNRKPRWHIDHLLIHPAFRLITVYCAGTHMRLECSLAKAIALSVIPGFGSSDCTCAGHLFYSLYNPDQQIRNAFERISLNPVIKNL